MDQLKLNSMQYCLFGKRPSALELKMNFFCAAVAYSHSVEGAIFYELGVNSWCLDSEEAESRSIHFQEHPPQLPGGLRVEVDMVILSVDG